jgi:hypothetical protein
MGARSQVGLLYHPARLHRLAKSIPGLPKSIKIPPLAGGYDNPIPTRFLAPIDCLQIPAQYCTIHMQVLGPNRRWVTLCCETAIQEDYNNV